MNMDIDMDTASSRKAAQVQNPCSFEGTGRLTGGGRLLYIHIYNDGPMGPCPWLFGIGEFNHSSMQDHS